MSDCERCERQKALLHDSPIRITFTGTGEQLRDAFERWAAQQRRPR